MSAYNLALRWFESGCHRKKKVTSIKNRYVFVTEIDQVQQEIKEKRSRSASNKPHRPTSEMPGKHQPSASSPKIFVSKSIASMSKGTTP